MERNRSRPLLSVVAGRLTLPHGRPIFKLATRKLLDRRRASVKTERGIELATAILLWQRDHGTAFVPPDWLGWHGEMQELIEASGSDRIEILACAATL